MQGYIHHNGAKIEIEIDKDGEIGRGATARIYLVRSPAYRDQVAKIYNDATRFNQEKIEAMLDGPPQQLSVKANGHVYPQFAWPRFILRDAGNRAIGFLMPRIDEAESFILNYFYDLTLAKARGLNQQQTLSQKLMIARNLSLLLAELHKRGHYVIDFKPENIKVFRKSRYVALLDCDSFSIKGENNKRYWATNYSSEYIAPEALRSKSAPKQLGESQDRYALAVVLFQLLNNGTHPFQGIPKSSAVFGGTDEKVKKGWYPYGKDGHPAIAPRPESIHNCFDDKLRAMFDQAFAGAPRQRPSAAQWHEYFGALIKEQGLRVCSAKPHDPMHSCFAGKPCVACQYEPMVTAGSVSSGSTKAGSVIGVGGRAMMCWRCGQQVIPLPGQSGVRALTKCPNCNALQTELEIESTHDVRKLDLSILNCCACCLGAVDTAATVRASDGNLDLVVPMCNVCYRTHWSRTYLSWLTLGGSFLLSLLVVGLAIHMAAWIEGINDYNALKLIASNSDNYPWWINVAISVACFISTIYFWGYIHGRLFDRGDKHARECKSIASADKLRLTQNGKVVGYRYRILFGNPFAARLLRAKRFRLFSR
jgi:DNA-binding helix-hairpin-helix protein with protein kinase domain